MSDQSRWKERTEKSKKATHSRSSWSVPPPPPAWACCLIYPWSVPFSLLPWVTPPRLLQLHLDTHWTPLSVFSSVLAGQTDANMGQLKKAMQLYHWNKRTVNSGREFNSIHPPGFCSVQSTLDVAKMCPDFSTPGQSLQPPGAQNWIMGDCWFRVWVLASPFFRMFSGREWRCDALLPLSLVTGVTQSLGCVYTLPHTQLTVPFTPPFPPLSSSHPLFPPLSLWLRVTYKRILPLDSWDKGVGKKEIQWTGLSLRCAPFSIIPQAWTQIPAGLPSDTAAENTKSKGLCDLNCHLKCKIPKIREKIKMSQWVYRLRDL